MPQLPCREVPQAPSLVQCSLLAHAVARVPLADIVKTRREMTLFGEPPFAKSFLKPSDEQTVVAVQAVLKAIEDSGLGEVPFGEWGVVAASQYFARRNARHAIEQFRIGGIWKVSPLFVPHYSLHAISGTISQALKIHGPNVGVGGKQDAFAEGLLTSLTMLEMHDVPGVWTVITRCEPDRISFEDPSSSQDVVCHAVALALVKEPTDTLPSLQLTPHQSTEVWTTACRSRTDQQATTNPPTQESDFFEFIQFLEQPDPGTVWGHTLSCGSRLQIVPAA
ncbi:MAG: beta-ketoacyl synthase N-terminal-like domain-containing protein [Gemmataceae bacterium]